MNLKYKIVVLFAFLFISKINAQIIQDVSGKPLPISKYLEIKGKIFFNDEWSLGYVKITSGKIYSGYLLKYDEFEDLPVYSIHDDIYSFIDKISEFGFKSDQNQSLVFRNGYKKTSLTSEDSFFQVLLDGDFKFLKKSIKNIIEDREYNTAIVTKKITSNTFYFIVDDVGMIFQVKKDEKSILSVLYKKPEITLSYIRENKLDLKKDKDVVKLISFYASAIKN
ncbi:hypothetical protein ACFOG5_15585 [Pedobacter fastidiosus]|uniref:Uncharacterized protein n=1 Tax=Pedobacter fastidiosus TaxID=2765361 RepID=A0ABR7KQ96_9SPHI|nr:hypothetical protein [Pedobacter fastidiosus]MBC6110254.1 hypothetical protein [Pedobacter fastidiosus]